MQLVRRASAISILTPLRHRPFALLWLGQSLSRVGDAVLSVALPWLVYDLTGSAVAMGSVAVLQRLPTVILLLVGGVTVDRLPKQRVMLMSDILQGIVVTAIALSISSGRVQLWQLQVMAVAFGTAGAFFRPAFSSITPQLVPKDELVPANALISASRSIAQVGGPLLGAVLVAVGSMATAFAFDAATFGASALCLLAVPKIAPALRSVQGRIRSQVAEGFQVVASSPWIWLGIVTCSVGNAANAGVLTVVLPLFVRDRLGGDVGTLGAVNSAMAVGFTVGMFAVGQYGMPKLRGLWFYGGILLIGLDMVAWGMSAGIFEAMAAAMLQGLVSSVIIVVWDASLQELVARELLGRVQSIDMMGSMALTPVGLALAGVTAEAIGATWTFVFAGFVSLGVAAVGLSSRRARNFG